LYHYPTQYLLVLFLFCVIQVFPILYYYIILCYFLRPRLKYVEIFTLHLPWAVSLDGHLCLSNSPPLNIYCIFFLCYTYCFKWQINFSISLSVLKSVTLILNCSIHMKQSLCYVAHCNCVHLREDIQRRRQQQLWQLTWHSPVSGSQSPDKPLQLHGTHSPDGESWRTR